MSQCADLKAKIGPHHLSILFRQVQALVTVAGGGVSSSIHHNGDGRRLEVDLHAPLEDSGLVRWRRRG
jgi:hypothetical protein